MAFNLKSATPDTSFPANAFLFGADSQSASDPSIYSHTAYLNYILGLNNSWTGVQTLTTPVLGAATGTSVTVTGLLQAGTTLGISTDVFLNKDAANTLALRNSTNAQTFRVYHTYTDASNYECGFIRYSSNVLQFGHDAVGTGTSNRLIQLTTNSTSKFTLDGSGNSYATVSIGVQNALLIQAPSNGVATLFNWDSNDFNRLQFGGTTASFPSLKRSSATLQARLADDSADAGFKSGNLAATGTQIDFTALPTSDPAVPGRLYRTAGAVMVSV